MKHRTSCRLAAGLLVALSLSAQEETGVFEDAVDVEAFGFEVYVTDADGRPVGGLGRGDFELVVDGERVEPTHFYEVRDGRRGIGTQAIDPVFLVLFIDNLHLGQLTRNRALDEIRGFLRRRLRRGDQIMLVSFDSRIRPHQAFTSEWKRLERGLGLIAREASYGPRREGRERRIITDLHHELGASQVGRTQCASELGRTAARHAEDVYQQVEASVSGLSDFVASLASLPGRKALAYLSDGIPLRPAARIVELVREHCVNHSEILDVAVDDTRRGALGATRWNTAALFEKLAERANAHRVTFFTVEASGGRAFSASDARRQHRRRLSQRAEEVGWRSLQDSLRTMAASTGGRAILDTLDLAAAFESISRDLDTYYSFGYRLPRPEDGRTYTLKVQARQPGLRVRHRRSLRRAALEDELAGRTRAALLYGATSNPLGIELGVAATQRMDALHMVPIEVRIPLGKITLLPAAGGHRGRLRIFVTGRDRIGRVAPVRGTEVPIEIPRGELETARSQVFLYEVRMLMRAGNHKVAVAVHDDLGSVSSFLVENVEVVDPSR